MRVGRLNIAAELITENGSKITDLLIGITDADDNISFADGLLSGARITVRARYGSAICAGRYLRAGNRLFIVNGVADPDGRKQDYLVSVRELRGMDAVVHREPIINARCFLLEYISKPSTERSLPPTQRRRVEFCNMEYRPRVGHEFSAQGSRWKIIELDAEGTTHVITRAWVEFLQHDQNQNG